MSAFIECNNGIINLGNVSNIGFIENKNRVIFNFNYSIPLPKKNVQDEEKIVADYKYADFSTQEDFEEFVIMLGHKAEELNFIMSRDEGTLLDRHWINPLHISFVGTDEPKNRIIFNMTNQTNKMIGGKNKIINDFIFWDVGSKEQFKSNMSMIYNTLVD
jgi:hypothetical protein